MDHLSILSFLDGLFIGVAIALFSIGYLLHLRKREFNDEHFFKKHSSAIYATVIFCGILLYKSVPTVDILQLSIIAIITLLTSSTIVFATQKEHGHIGFVMFPALIIGSGFFIIYGLDIFVDVLNDKISMQYMLLLSTFLFSVLSAFVSIRFFQQIARSDLKNLHWVLIGGVAIGITFTSIRYSLFASANLLNDLRLPNNETLDLSILPFTTIVFSVLIIELVISILAEKNRSFYLRMYDALLNNPSIAIITTDNEGIILHSNKSVYTLTGFKSHEIIGNYFHEFFTGHHSSKDKEGVNYQFEEVIKIQENTFTVTKKNNTTVELQYNFIPLKEKNTILGWYVLLKDMTQHIQLEKDMSFLMGHDQLTGLAKREVFQSYIEGELTTERKLAVYMIGINRFKRINESKGHIVGDTILKQISERLKETDSGKMISRIGGDEFALVKENYENENDLLQFAENIQASINEPFYVGNEEFYITCSIGISQAKSEDNHTQTLLKNAATALEYAKNEKAGIKIFRNTLSINKDSQFELEHDLRKANYKEEFKIYYQPQIDLITGKVCGVEALIRWYHPTKGIINPGVFIPLAEEVGLIDKIGEWVLYKACKQNKKWQELGLPKIRVSVNLALNQFYDKKFINKLNYILNKTNLDPKYLDLEITETMAMKNLTYSIETFNAIKKLGVQLSIDDFGKGFSSFGHLKEIPVDRIKIDKAFVQDIETNKESEVIVKSILSLTNSLGLISLAEGVETISHEKILRELNCNELQGFYYSPPLKANGVKRLLSK